ncbi:MAG TPA: molybdopterin converting factor subunit 1 [Longimicrobiales bacterium]
MQISVLLFAQYRDAAGTSELQLDVPAGATALHAVELVRARGADATRIPERPVVAVNQEYSSLDHILSDGDELALLPPVAGG